MASKGDKDIRAWLGGRIARNIYFWLLLIYTRIDFQYNITRAAITALLFLLLAVLFYGNTLFLIPRLLARKRRLTFLLWYIAIAGVVSLCYITVLKLMVLYHPNWHPGSVSPIVYGRIEPLSRQTLFTCWWDYFYSIAVCGGIFAMSWYVLDYESQQRQAEAVGKEQLEHQLSFLKQQINPHFLFNSLNNLYTLTISKSNDAPEVLARISMILRYLLYESDTRLVSAQKDAEIMHAYIALELLRVSNTEHMQFDIKVDPEKQIPPLLWLPVLENVFKHGTGYISDYYEINYIFHLRGNRLLLTASNHCKPQSQQEEYKGIGLQNLRQRLNLLYPERHRMMITRQLNRFLIQIEIKLSDQ